MRYVIGIVVAVSKPAWLQLLLMNMYTPIPMAARPKQWDYCCCSCLLAGIAGSTNPSGSMDVLKVVYCHVEVSATGRSLVQRSPTECVSLNVMKCNNNRLHLQCVGVILGQKERKKERLCVLKPEGESPFRVDGHEGWMLLKWI